MRPVHVLGVSAALYAIAALGLPPLSPLSPPLLAQSPVRTFKVAFYNIQSGKGKQPLPGIAAPFADTGNCTDPTLPLNAWGKGIVQAELAARVAGDPSVVALGLAEAWACANPAAVKAALQWPAVSGERNGVALLSRY